MNDIRVFDSTEELYQEAARIFWQAGTEASLDRGRFAVSLSGGSTPLPLYRLLVEQNPQGSPAWDTVHFFWGDERPVGPDHLESNYRGAYRSLLAPLKIPSENIHRIRGELPPDDAAAAYEEVLSNWFGPSPFQFDLVLLGLGDDGHTASLFPGTSLVEKARQGQTGWVEGVHVPQLKTWRVSMTPRLINAACRVLFLVRGSQKAAVLREVLQGPYQPQIYPAQLIQPVANDPIWLVDGEAAAELASESKN